MGLARYRKYGSWAARISDAIKADRVPHAYIIEGDSNYDKTGFAKAVCKAMVCRQMPGEGCGECVECRKIDDGIYEDLYVVSPDDGTEKKTGTNTVKDADVEELQTRLKTKPTAGEHNFAIVEHADTMTKRAQTRFLKTLEEPPEGTVIMLLAENSEDLLPTIDSRCVSIRLYREDAPERDIPDDIVKVFDMICKKEFFYEIKEKISGYVKTRDDAYSYLDGMEALIGKVVRKDGSSVISSESARRSVELIERARTDIKLGASFNHVVKRTALELEDILND